MKKIFATTLAAAVMVAAPALAQEPGAPVGNTLTYTLDAEVGVVCGVYGNGSQTLALDFGDLANLSSTTDVTRSANVAYRCNTTTGFTRTVSSANGGNLVRQGSDTLGSNQISYRFQELRNSPLHPAELDIRSRTLGSAATSQHNGSGQYLTGVSTTQSFTVSGLARTGSASLNGAPGTTVFAGDYADTVTVSVTAR